MTDIAKNVANETVLAFYNVLDRWIANKKRFGYEDLQSLFKSKLIIEVKHFYGVTTGIRITRDIDMAIIYREPYVASVNIHKRNYGTTREVISDLIDAFQAINFVNLYDKRTIVQSEPNKVKQVEDVTTINDINFESIINIKF